MKNNKSKIILAAAFTLFTAIMITGCSTTSSAVSSSDTQNASAQGVAGAVLLSINPEIEIQYDADGKVLNLEGLNDDGVSIISQYTDYEGADCSVIIHELVDNIYENGYFSNLVEGHEKNIVVKLEPGSACPDNNFLDEIAESVREVVASKEGTSKVVPITNDDLDDKGFIGLDAAKNIVLSQLGLDEAAFSDREYELDDSVYELEFTANGIEYKFEVNASNGKVLRADYETNDDWSKYDDTDDIENEDESDDDLNDIDDDHFDDDLDDSENDDDFDDDLDDVDDDDFDDDLDDSENEDESDDDLDDVNDNDSNDDSDDVDDADSDDDLDDED